MTTQRIRTDVFQAKDQAGRVYTIEEWRQRTTYTNTEGRQHFVWSHLRHEVVGIGVALMLDRRTFHIVDLNITVKKILETHPPESSP